VRAWLNFLTVKSRRGDGVRVAIAYLSRLSEASVATEVVAKSDFGNVPQHLAGERGQEEMALASLITRLEEAGVEGCEEDGKIVARCVMQLDKTAKWLTGGEVDVGKWKGVTAEGRKAGG